MEYTGRICIERIEFNELLTSSHDCTTFLNISLFFVALLGTSLLGSVHFLLSQQREIDGLVQVKKSLMKHIVSLEEDFAVAHSEEQEDVTNTIFREEPVEPAEDTKPHAD
jgi:hypothetical protein